MEEGQFMYDIAHVKYSYEFKLRYFDYMCQRYIYDPESGFDKAVYDVARPFRGIQRDLSRGLDNQQAVEHQSRFGRNNLDVPVPHYGRLFISEVLHPFYIFQIASCAIWYWDQYWSSFPIDFV
jgi:cation-transporting ATPase 13A3/4/5